MKTAAVMVLVRDGLILACSRKNNPLLGLPGGKSDPGESPQEAAIRETYEETGIQVSSCAFIYQAVDSKFQTYCFYATSWTGDPVSMEGTTVMWVAPDTLTHPDTGAFPNYNNNVIQVLRSLSLLPIR